MTKTVKISLFGVFALGIFSSLAVFAQTATTDSLTLTGGSYINSTNVTTAAGGSLTYNWSSTNAVGGKSSLQISKNGSSVTADGCGNQSGDFSAAVGGISGALGPITIPPCQAGYTYTINYSVTNSSGQSVPATPVTITVTGGSAGGTTSGQTVACSQNASTYVAPLDQTIIATLPNFPPFPLVTMDTYMAKVVQGDLSNLPAFLNPQSNVSAKANITSDMIKTVNDRCNFYPSICVGIDQTAMGQKYATLLINNLEMICAAPYGTGLTGSIYENYKGGASSGGTSGPGPTLNISSVSECPSDYGQCPNSSPTAASLIGGDSYTLTLSSAFNNAPITFYWQNPTGVVTSQAIGSTDGSGKWTLSAVSAASVTPGVWQEWAVFAGQSGNIQSNKITVTILPVPASCLATGQLCTGNETSGACRPELQQSQCVAGSKSGSTCQIPQIGTGSQFATFCTGMEKGGPCRPDNINQCAAERLAETWGPSCIAPKITAPAIDLNTSLYTHYAAQCMATTTPSTGGTGGTGGNPSSGGTGGNPNTGGTGGGIAGNSDGALTAGNAALTIELKTFTSQLTNILSQLSGSTLDTTAVTALTSEVGQITQLVASLGSATSLSGYGSGTTVIATGGVAAGSTGGAGGGTSAVTTNGGPTVNPTATAPVLVTVTANLLNVRSAPSLSASILSTLPKGKTVSVTGAVMGDMVSGENYWWATGTGSYIWAGGTSEQPNPSSVASG